MSGDASGPVRRAITGLAVLAGVVLALLGALTLLVSHDPAGLDAAILVRVRGVTGDTGRLVNLATDVTALGNDVTLWIVTLLGAGYLIAARRRAAALHLLIAAAGGGLVTSGLKAVIHRSRPAVVGHLVDVQSLSFPSGHAANSTFVYATLALLASQHARTDASRRYLATATLAVLLTIGASRVILGVHYPTDVLAGWLVGAGWALAVDHLWRLLVGGWPDPIKTPGRWWTHLGSNQGPAD